MSIFVKAGLWIEKKVGHKGEFNLTKFVEDLIAATPAPAPTSSYKVYTALINQTADNVPTAIVLENTLGGPVTFGYQGVGDYEILLPSTIDINKTFYTISYNVSSSLNSQLYYNGGNSIGMVVYVDDEKYGRTNVDNSVEYTPIEIRIYN
jgi:hypothetical protein